MSTTARIRLRVAPGARTTQVVGRHGDAWKIRVSAAPERGAANDAVRRCLSERLGLTLADVTLVSGHASRDKVVEIRGLDAAEAERRLEAAA